jgi:hypothetical protein
VWRLDSNLVLVLSTCTSHRTDAAKILYQVLENCGGCLLIDKSLSGLMLFL